VKEIMPKKGKEKPAHNNQWSGNVTDGNSGDNQEKSEYNNEWVSTNNPNSSSPTEDQINR